MAKIKTRNMRFRLFKIHQIKVKKKKFNNL